MHQSTTWADIKKSDDIKYCEGMECENSYYTSGRVKWSNHVGKQFGII